ncbi:hypothetical protein [Alicyclobacillus dauci]|uniref:Uncharacterized protein n=1 Tax=Alicyclobacillus dauci TaxID=1475485 RepID=A0ABY6Z5T1_9BACL|nr:hypothetical protein [Alicyclobacillus dauci]WAH38258.1 hypothetical protein NZD86_07185 [Alicyclobacillus dauci]
MGLREDLGTAGQQLHDMGNSTNFKSHLVLGDKGHLSQTDMDAIHQHFEAIVQILGRAGLDKVHMMQFFDGLIQNWWIDVSVRVVQTIVEWLPI